MKKVASFIKNYWKVLLVSLIGMVLILAFSMLAQYLFFKYEVSSMNEEQLVKIAEKYESLKETCDLISEEVGNAVDRDFSVAYRLLSLEPEDAYNQEYLTKTEANLDGIDNLLVLDRDRNLINEAGQVREINYKDPYYDELFYAAQGIDVELCDKDSETLKTKCVNCGDYYLLTQEDTAKTAASKMTEEELWKLSKMSVGLNSHSVFAVADAENSKLIYSELEELSEMLSNSDGEFEESLDQIREDFHVQCYETEEAQLFALVSRSVFATRGELNFAMTLALLIIINVILVSYIVCLRAGELDPKQEYKVFHKYFLRSQTSGFKALAIVVGIVAAVCFFFFQNMNGTSLDLFYLEHESKECVDVCEAFDEYLRKVDDSISDMTFGYGKIAGDFLDEHEEYMSKEGMEKLSEAFMVKDVSIFDERGQTICTSSPLDNLNVLADPASSLYELRYVLTGKEGVVTPGDEELMPENEYLYGVPKRDEDGIAEGMIVLSRDLDEVSFVRMSVLDAGIMETKRNSDSFVVFIVDEGGNILTEGVSDPDESVDAAILLDGNYGRVRIGGKEHQASVRSLASAGLFLLVAAPIQWVGGSTILCTLLFVILYILMALWMWYDGLGSKYRFEWRAHQKKDADDWERTELYWEELSIGKKMGRILSFCLYGITIFLIVELLFLNQDGVMKTMMNSVVGDSWKGSVNRISVFYNFCIICLFFTGTRLLMFLFRKLECIVGTTGATGCRLLSSVIKYVSAILCIVIVVTNFGVDAVAAIASIGIIGFALSFGAQELIKDLIAGVFILFEGNFKVGDMLDYNGDWYWIKSIGVRTTTLEAWGSIKVVNNSQMTGIVNIENASASVNVDIWLTYQYSPEEVERIMNEELPALKQLYPAEVSTPVWKGVQEISASGMLVRLRVYCPPLYQGWVGRSLKQEAKRILDAHGIELAYEAYVIHSQVIKPDEIKKEMQGEMEELSKDSAEEQESKEGGNGDSSQ